MKNIFIYPNISKSDIFEATQKIVCKLLKHNIKIFLPDFFNESVEKVIKLPVDECIKCADLIITLGGDGTMLTVINKSAKYDIPIIGINFGHLGFLTELEINELEYLDLIFQEKYKIEKRMLLDIKVKRDGKTITHDLALNDVIIKTENSFRIMEMEVFSDGDLVLDFGGDGVIVATPTGSTAYSLSAGGPIIEPNAENICVTPICSHRLAGKSFVFSKDRVITINPLERNNNKSYIAIDGNNALILNENDIIEIKKSEHYTPFIRIKGQKFYDILNRKIRGSI